MARPAQRARRHRAYLAAAAAIAALLGAAPAADALEFTITITGTPGKDEVTVFALGPLRPDTAEWRITPAVPLTVSQHSDGIPRCDPINDPLTSRQIGWECRRKTAGADRDQFRWSIDLRAGDDSLTIQAGEATGFTATGGTGNDTLEVDGRLPRTVRGGDGDDILSAPVRSHDPVTFEGGAGNDRVDYAKTMALSEGAGGVTADLASGQAAVFVGSPDPARQAPHEVNRFDTLTGIERLSGTPLGDIFTGTADANELLGQGGPDLLTGADGNDVLRGGDGEDRLDGGNGGDILDGGSGLDEFPLATGGDTFLTRDGYAEDYRCINKDVVVSDLVDKVGGLENCSSFSSGQAKHLFDTLLPRGSLAIDEDRTVHPRVRCPAEKPDRCAGTLLLRRGNRGTVLAKGRYKLRPGRSARVPLRLSAKEARQVRGERVTLDAAEVDADRRARRVLARPLVR